MRTTQAELRAIFAQLTESAANHGVDTTKWELSRWAPGDGVARYRIESDGGSTHPLGSSYRGAAEMSSAMRLAVQLLWQTPEECTAREHVEHDGPHSPDCCVCPRGVRSHWAVCPAGARLRIGTVSSSQLVERDSLRAADHLGDDDAGLGVGHIWTAVQCPAYRTLKGADCTCEATS